MRKLDAAALLTFIIGVLGGITLALYSITTAPDITHSFCTEMMQSAGWCDHIDHNLTGWHLLGAVGGWVLVPVSIITAVVLALTDRDW